MDVWKNSQITSMPGCCYQAISSAPFNYSVQGAQHLFSAPDVIPSSPASELRSPLGCCKYVQDQKLPLSKTRSYLERDIENRYRELSCLTPKAILFIGKKYFGSYQVFSKV
jgi:hypothetical protein